MLDKEEFEDTKGVIKICKSKKDRHFNGQKKKGKRTNNMHINLKRKIEDTKVTTRSRKSKDRQIVVIIPELFHISIQAIKH